LLIIAVVFGCGCAHAQEKLPGLNVNINDTTVGGLSAGGFFAVQMHVAFSNIIKASAVFAGGPFHCAQSQIGVALSTCMTALPAPQTAKYIRDTGDFFNSKKIADPSNLKNHSVYLFGGSLDTKVRPPVMQSLFAYYSNFVKTPIVYETKIPAAHTQPTDDPTSPNACNVMATPWVSNCNYDGAGEAFKKIIGNLHARNNGTLNGRIVKFDQTEFLATPRLFSLDLTGFVFIPKQCENGERCRLHISFHGCHQMAGSVGDAYYAKAGYNKWADTNNIVVLYPQTVMSNAFPVNPQGCFDWWGYNNAADYDTIGGTQMKAFRAMMDRIGSKYRP